MTRAVIDSSVVVKWIIGEDDSATALELRRHYLFVAPEFQLAEAANAVLTKVRRGQVTESEARSAAELIGQFSIVFEPLQPLVEDAVALGLDLRHPIYDCFFLVLAAKLGCPLVTADRALIEKSANLQVSVLSMQQAIDRALALD